MCAPANTPPARSKFAEHLFAWVWGHVHGPLEKAYGKRKSILFNELRGDVVEIGAGSGINFLHYPTGLQLTCIEPNPYMHPYLRESAAASGHALNLLEGYAEALPLPDASADAVVSTLVLCSVFNPDLVLSEILRVLRPGGRFYFIEHVAAQRGTRLRRVQDAIQPIWTRLGDGCNPNRETHEAIRRAGFSECCFESRDIKIPLPPVKPHILGYAVK